jgi:tetratricopeptide (TPR) repeat protein
LLLGLAACASQTTQPKEPVSAGTRRAVDESSRQRPPRVAAVTSKPAASDAVTDPRALREAQELLKQGLAAYHIGAYDEAENLLKRSITLYPFLAPANLALGKIFLLKGAANRDEALIQSARLMFDMAHNIDPSLREPKVLLELFKPRGN